MSSLFCLWRWLVNELPILITIHKLYWYVFFPCSRCGGEWYSCFVDTWNLKRSPYHNMLKVKNALWPLMFLSGKGDFMWLNMYHTIREPKNGWNWEGSLDKIWSNPSASAGSPAANCSRPCPDVFHVSVRMGTSSLTLLGKSCQYSVTLTVKTFFLVFDKEYAVSDCAHQLLSFTGHHCKEPGSIFIISALQEFVHIYEIPLNLLFSMLSISSCHNFPSCNWCLNPLVTVMGFHWSLVCGSILSVAQFLNMPLHLTAVLIFCLHTVPRLWKVGKKSSKEGLNQ